MKLRVFAGKIVASGALLAVAAVFLVFFGPRPTPAYADIYGPLTQAAGFLAPPPGSPTLRVGTALVNGQPFEYAIGRSVLRLDDVLGHYERQFETKTPASDQPLSTAARVQGPGAGVVAGVRFGPLLRPGEFTQRIRTFGETKRLADFGQFHLVSAFEQQGTVFIEFTSGASARIDRLLPAGAADAPGEDPPGVRRPDGLQRFLTIEHGEGRTWSRTIIYRAQDSRAAVGEFGRAFAAAGWVQNPAIAPGAVAHFSDGQRESFVGGAGKDRDSAVVLVLRRL